MLKILIGFIIFAAVALAVVFNMGDKADMAGETGGHKEAAEEKAPAAAPAQAPAAAPAEEKK